MFTALVGSVLVLFSLNISIFAKKQRRRTQTAYGSGDDKVLSAAVTAHSNFISYTPLFLITLYFLEVTFKASYILVLCLGLAFIISRILHFYGVCYSEQQSTPNFKFRIAGMMLTFSSLLVTALLNIYFLFKELI